LSNSGFQDGQLDEIVVFSSSSDCFRINQSMVFRVSDIIRSSNNYDKKIILIKFKAYTDKIINK
jgi:hypothetical protein